jgi:lipopolysaccharide/colanic/teichoic acid biosynthesis glycosyltransferase
MNNRSSNVFKIFAGVISIFSSIWLAILIKPNTLPLTYIQNQYDVLIILFSTWFTISMLFKKYTLGAKRDLRRILPVIFRTNLIIVGITTLIMFALRELDLSRFVLFTSMLIGTILEIVFFISYKQVVHSKKIDDSLQEFIDQREKLISRRIKTETITKRESKHVSSTPIKHSSHIASYIIQESSEEVYNFIATYFDFSKDNFTILSTTTRFNVMKLAEDCFCCIANLKRVNDIRYINKFFEAVNIKLLNEGYFISCVETKNMRKKRIMKKFPPVLNMIYYFFDFLFKRVAPKFNITKKLYFFLTRGENRVVSKAETLGRLYSCGFDVVETKTINRYMYFVAQKVNKPFRDSNPTYGPLIKLRRIGKNGEFFYVYKFRTMHPFSEYLQAYIYKNYDLKEGGKFKNDFRITTLGKIMRKFWIDELPMMLNLIKGDMKIVGVRPLSKHYFDLYNDELKQARIKTKPGLIPPFYADMPKTLEEIQASELKYLKQHARRPFLTDWKYFWKAFFNIIFKKARSA